jgi:hypothetical protein
MAEADQEKRSHGKRTRLRDEDFDKKLYEKSIRTEPLGWDRHSNCYWLMHQCGALVWVESCEGDKLGVFLTPQQLQDLHICLLSRGNREKNLAQVRLH